MRRGNGWCLICQESTQKSKRSCKVNGVCVSLQTSSVLSLPFWDCANGSVRGVSVGAARAAGVRRWNGLHYFTPGQRAPAAHLRFLSAFSLLLLVGSVNGRDLRNLSTNDILWWFVSSVCFWDSLRRMLCFSSRVISLFVFYCCRSSYDRVSRASAFSATFRLFSFFKEYFSTDFVHIKQ